jgi:hypothetical protein
VQAEGLLSTVRCSSDGRALARCWERTDSEKESSGLDAPKGRKCSSDGPGQSGRGQASTRLWERTALATLGSGALQQGLLTCVSDQRTVRARTGATPHAQKRKGDRKINETRSNRNESLLNFAQAITTEEGSYPNKSSLNSNSTSGKIKSRARTRVFPQNEIRPDTRAHVELVRFTPHISSSSQIKRNKPKPPQIDERKITKNSSKNHRKIKASDLERGTSGARI